MLSFVSTKHEKKNCACTHRKILLGPGKGGGKENEKLEEALQANKIKTFADKHFTWVLDFRRSNIDFSCANEKRLFFLQFQSCFTNLSLHQLNTSFPAYQIYI